MTFNQTSIQWTGGESNSSHRSCKDQSPPWDMPARNVNATVGIGPTSLPYQGSALPLSYEAVVRAGVEPAVCRRGDRRTGGPTDVSARGWGRTSRHVTTFSTGPLFQFAYTSLSCECGIEPQRRAYETQSCTSTLAVDKERFELSCLAARRSERRASTNCATCPFA